MPVTLELNSDEAKLIRGIAKTEGAIEKLTQRLRELEREGKRTNDGVEDGMKKTEKASDRASGALGKQVAAYVSVGAAIGVATSALRAFQQQEDRAVASLLAITDATVRLNQVATSPEDLKSLQARADALSRKSGVDANTSRNLVFRARSEGFEGELETIFGLTQLIAPDASANVFKTGRLFPGNTLSNRALLNASLASAGSSELNVEQLAAQLPSVAEGSAAAGAGVVESLALQSVLSGQFARGSTSADRIKAFGIKLGLPGSGFGGQGIIGGAQALAAASPESRAAFLGESAELNTAFRKVQEQLPQLIERRDFIAAEVAKTGTSGSLINLGLGRATGDPGLAATLELQRAEQGLSITERDRFSSSGASKRAAVLNVQERLTTQGRSQAQIFAGRGFAEATRFLGGGERAITASGRVGSRIPGLVANRGADDVEGIAAEAFSVLLDAARELSVAAAKIRARNGSETEDLTPQTMNGTPRDR